MGGTARLAAAGPRVGFTALSPGGIHRPVSRVGSTARPAAAVPWVGLTARLVAAGPRMGRTARWSLPVPGWTIPLGSPDGPHRPLVAAGPRLGYTARPIYRYTVRPRMGRTARLAATGPRMGHTARRSLPVPGWAIPLGHPGGPHRPVDCCRSPGGFHRPADRCRSPRVFRTARLAAAGPE